MKSWLSLISCLLITLVLLSYRTWYSDIREDGPKLILTQWDAFGYYQYLPAACIYHDYKKLDWAPAIDKRYNVTGGDGLPVQELKNGNKVCKYLCGVAIMQAPFFAIAHLVAKSAGYPADGFSAPYQYSLAFGAILYCFLALLLLRRVLLRSFKDSTVAISLLLLCLASNFVQYAAVHSGLSHVWIFPLYSVLIFATIKWHEQPKAAWAVLIGYSIGLLTICRPTEAIALFIPLFWNMHSPAASREKWHLVKSRPTQVLFVVMGGIAGILPQLLYWKAVTGSFIYDVGSKWMFFDPWFRVLSGWEKGWFIYTPVTIFFVLGLFFMKRYPFRIAALVFCLLNIWIVISWEDWHYGASYSCRALVQSYPVFALPLAAFIDRAMKKSWRILIGIASLYLIGVNLFQTLQYNSTILHYDEMNRQYYGRIYLNANPSALDMSLLDTDEWLKNEHDYQRKILLEHNEPLEIQFPGPESQAILDTALTSSENARPDWLRISARILAPDCLWKSRLVAELRQDSTTKRVAIRLDNPVGSRTNEYDFYMRVPKDFNQFHLVIHLTSAGTFKGKMAHLTVAGFYSHR